MEAEFDTAGVCPHFTCTCAHTGHTFDPKTHIHSMINYGVQVQLNTFALAGCLSVVDDLNVEGCTSQFERANGFPGAPDRDLGCSRPAPDMSMVTLHEEWVFSFLQARTHAFRSQALGAHTYTWASCDLATVTLGSEHKSVITDRKHAAYNTQADQFVLIACPTACDLNERHDAGIVLTLEYQQHCHIHAACWRLMCLQSCVKRGHKPYLGERTGCKTTSPQHNSGSGLSQPERQNEDQTEVSLACG